MDTNLFIAKDVNPDQFAKAKTIADEMGLSPQFVNNSLPEFEKKQNELKVQNDLNELTYSAPVTKEFVSNPDNLILSQDSLKELSDFEQKIARRNESQYYNNFVSGIYGMAANVAQLPGVFGYIQRENQKFANKVSKDINIAPTDLVPDVEVVVSEQDAKDQFQYFKNNSFVNNLRENQNYFAAKAPDAQMSVIDEAKKGNFLNAGRALSLQVVGNAPNLIANMAAYWAGGPVLGSVTAFVPTFSQSATEAIEKGKPESALTSGAVQGAAEVLFENLGSFRILKNTEQQLVKTIGKEGAKEVIFNSAKQLVNNSFQEGTEEFATSIAQDLTKYIVENDSDALKGLMTRAFDSFLVGAGSGVGISAAGNVSGLIRYNQKIKQAESDAELYSALAGKTKLSERSTEAQKEFIAKQTEGGPIENTYITREGLKEYAQKQNKSETEIAQEMGILEEFNKSVETETDIEVSTSKMATDVAKSIHHAELKNDIKFNPENLSYNEAQKAQEETKAQVQEQYDAAMTAMPEETQIKYKESAKEVYKLIAQDLRMTDKMSSQETTANAQIWENTFLTYGVLTNTDPLELFKKYGVNIRAIDSSVPSFEEMIAMPSDLILEAKIDESGNIANIDENILLPLKQRIKDSEAGERIVARDENGNAIGNVGKQSTFPDFLQNKGYSKKELLNIIDKYQTGKKLTEKQIATLLDIYNSAVDKENRREYYQINPKTFFQSSNKLFQDKKASFQVLGNKQFNINLFETSDESSFMHESAHYFLEVMKDLATEQNARPEMVELFNDVLKTLNVESADQIGEQQQEIFARSFEAYLMKGEAPSKGLRKAFAQFKTFLINIYKNLTGLEKQAEPYGINVSDQMKAVFDRMLVAGEEILDAEKNGPQSLFTDAVLTGLNAEKAEKYINAMNEAREYAEDELRAKLMKDVIKKKDKAFNEKYDELVQKGIELANSLTEFKVMQTIRENKQFKISKPYVEKYFPELFSYIPKDLMIQDGGVNPDFVAEMFGYPTGYAMLEAIKPYRKGAEAFAETYAATKIKEQFPELIEQPELSDEAVKAAHNDNYSLVKRLELEFLQEQFSQIVKDTAVRLIRRMPKTQAVIQQADNIIAQTNVSQIKPHLFLNAEKKHAAEAAKQFKKGEFELAFEAKRKEYLNFELYRAAIKAKEDVNKSVKSFKRLFKSDEDMAKRYDMDLINASRAILAMYGIGKPGKLPSEYIEKIKQYDAEAYITIEALVKSVMDGAANYESVSYDKFVEMRDTVNAIFDLARSNKEFEIEGKKVEMESIVDDLSERLKVITPADTREYYKTASEWENHKDMLMGAVATTKRVESWALGLGGNFHKYIYQPIADATTAYRLRKIEVLKQYRSLLDTYIKDQPGFEEPIVANELKFKGKTFVFQSKSELITLLLHTGNESNKSKMLEGYGWGERNQQGELVSPQWDAFINRMIAEGKLTKNDFDFVQGVWDLFESLKPEIQKTHKELLGFYMNEITAKEFSNQFGTYNGGYAPAKTDFTEVSETFTRELVDQINSDASFVFPTTGRGATKSRVESYKAPLSRDINLIGSHIDWALRYAYIERAAKQVGKLLKNKQFMSAMNDFDNAAIRNLLVPWLDRTSKQKVVEQSKDGMWRYIGNMAAFLRRNVNMQIMTFNVVNSLEQFGGLAVATAKVKPKYIRTSLINYMSNGPAMVDDIMIKSDFMRSINGENIYDIHNAINEIIVKPTKVEEFQDFARKNVYVLQSATQNIVNTIVWSGAYAEAKDSGVSENEAIKLADSVVRTTQGTNLPEDISKFETGSQTELLFKTYVSYFNMLTNLAASRVNEIERSVGLRKGAGELFYLYAAVLAVPSAISMSLRLGAAGVVDEDDDDFYIDDLLANFFGYQLKTVAAGIPYAGQFAVAGINRVMTKNQLDDRVSLSPAVSILENMVTVPGAVAEQIIERGELSKKNVKDALTFMGVVSSLPIGVLGKPVGYIIDVESGKARPTGPIDFTRGLVTGKPGSN